MKTDATQEVVYGILLKKYYDEIYSEGTLEKIKDLFEDVRKAGYDCSKIEDMAGIPRKNSYFFPRWINSAKRDKDTKQRLYYATLSLNLTLESIIESEGTIKKIKSNLSQ